MSAASAYRSGRPRRAPFPFHCVVAGEGLLLGLGEGQQVLVATKPQDMSSAAPTDYDYSADDPRFGRTQPFDDLSLGYGLATQQAFRDRRYHYALNIDASVSGGGPWLKGPSLTTVTPATVDNANGVSHFFELGATLYALDGRYCLARTNDTTWAVANDFGANSVAQSAFVFYSNAANAAQTAFVAMGDSEKLYSSTDGSNWSQHADLYARDFATVGRELWRAHSINRLCKCDTDADPLTTANWGADFTVGDKSSAITRLAVTSAGTLLVFKTDGVYTLDGAGEDRNLYPFLRFAPDSDGGKAYGAWLNDLYVSYREGLFRISPDLTLEQVGPERLTGNDSVVKGRITALAGHDTHRLYAAIKNPDTNNSYLLSFGAWATGQDGPAARLDAWHGSLTPAFTAKTVKALCKSTIGAATGHSRLYIGCSDGTISFFTLACTPNPAACASYQFSTSDGYLYLPRWSGLFGSNQKALLAATVTGGSLSSTNYVELGYDTALAGTYTDLGTDFTVTPRQRAEWPAVASGALVDFRVTLKSADANSCPEVTGIGIEHALVTEPRLVYSFNVLAADGLIKRDGSPLRIGAARIADVVKAAAGATSLSVTLPDETVKKLRIVGYGDTTAFDERTRQYRKAISVQAVELLQGGDAAIIYGSVERLAPYTVGDLAPYTIGQLRAL